MQLQSTIIDDLAGNLDNSKINKRLFEVESIYDGVNAITKLDYDFENLQGPIVYDIFTDDELKVIDKIILHPRDRSFKKKFQKLDAIIKPKGFKRSGCGTNRVVYEPLDDNVGFCVKIALDRAGKKNNPDEIVNQKYLKPFVAKCFDISPDGNVGIFERVVPIENLYQFWSVRDDIYNIMESIIGRFIIDDFGTKAFKNWGLRKGFGPVLLDYADMYILDPKILFCNHPTYFGSNDICRGELDYDGGFNNIICLKCGGIHMASEFKDGRKKIALFTRKRVIGMRPKIRIFKNNECILDTEKGYASQTVNEELELNKPSEEAQKELDQIEDLKAEAESIAIKNQTLEAKIVNDRYVPKVKVRRIEEDEPAKIKISIRANNPAEKEQDKFAVEKLDLKPRDLSQTMHQKAINIIKNNDAEVETTIPESSKHEEMVKNDSVKDINLNKEEETTEVVKLLTSDEILAMSEGLKDAADDHREVQDTDDKYSYNEILEMDKKFTYLLKEADESKNMTIESILPASFASYTGIDNLTKHVNIGQFKELLHDELADCATVILDAKLDYENDLDEEEYVPKAPVKQRTRARMQFSNNY